MKGLLKRRAFLLRTKIWGPVQRVTCAMVAMSAISSNKLGGQNHRPTSLLALMGPGGRGAGLGGCEGRERGRTEGGEGGGCQTLPCPPPPGDVELLRKSVPPLPVGPWEPPLGNRAR